MNELWTIKYWLTDTGKNEIERWYSKLDNLQAASVAQELALLRKCGNSLKLPHSRALGKKLFELRERTYGYRIYYTFYEHHVIVLLVAGDKSSQPKDIVKARIRIEELYKYKGACL